jgi:hypothetical protein
MALFFQIMVNYYKHLVKEMYYKYASAIILGSELFGINWDQSLICISLSGIPLLDTGYAESICNRKNKWKA